jgi:exopolyphosphatase/guanosine-5'-triphosphate,3'-diphosphate pyrophosphatase
VAKKKKKTSKKKSSQKNAKTLKKANVNPRRLAAIDIGSNAIRMVIAEHQTGGLKILKKFRFPIRLGADVFSQGQISGKNLKLSARTFRQFKQLSEKFKVAKLKAVATSALREARNKKAYIELIERKSNIRIELIDGVEEARVIYQAVKREVALENSHALLIDVGGGSVELTFSDRAFMSSTQSFPFGTVRTLEYLKTKKLTEKDLPRVATEFLKPLTHFLQAHGPDRLDFAVGTGGNLETLGKLKPLFIGGNVKTWLSQAELQVMIERLSQMSLEDRIKKLDLRSDRADVIIPASWVVLTVMRQAQVEKILIPHVGLKDGVLWSLAQETSYLTKALG